jgi:hypothetical protein
MSGDVWVPLVWLKSPPGLSALLCIVRSTLGKKKIAFSSKIRLRLAVPSQSRQIKIKNLFLRLAVVSEGARW